MDHAVSHDGDFFLIIGTADGDDFPADSGSCDGTSLWPAVSGSDNDDETGIPGGIDTTDEDGVFSYISVGKRADRDVDDPYAELSLVLADPAQSGKDIGGASASLTIKNFNGNQGTPGCDSAETSAGETAVSCNDSADMGAMTVVIVGRRFASDDIAESADLCLKIWMGSTAGIEYGNADSGSG